MSAISASQGNTNNAEVAALLKSSPDKYVSLGDLVGDYAKPDNRDLLIKTFGDQGITGFLQLTGATRSAGNSDEVQYWEEGRLHRKITSNATGLVKDTTDTNLGTITFDDVTGKARKNDVLMDKDGDRFVVVAVDDANNQLDVRKMDGAAITNDAAARDYILIGNIHAQGTSQPTEFYQTDVKKRTNSFMITKETYEVNGSQATNIGWINLGNGDYRWYVKGEMDTRKRFMDQREMMMLFAQDADLHTNDKIYLSNANDIQDASYTGDAVTGSEGYFQALERRGINASGSFGDGAGFADVDEIIFELDKNGAPHEYAMYVDTKTSLAIDDMLASGVATQNTAGLAGQFGAFNNSPDMAVQLGFKSFTRGGYTFHKHGWKLMSDPNLLGAFDSKPFKGAMVPLTQVVDAKTGTKAPALEMNYKEANGYSRELEHWVEGGGVLGFKTNDKDTAKFHYRSECNLITRAANQHVLLKD